MKNEKTKLDHIDIKLLNELQNDGKISNVDLARIVNISPPSCLRRVKSLEESALRDGRVRRRQPHRQARPPGTRDR